MRYITLLAAILALFACEPDAGQNTAQDTTTVEAPMPPRPVMEGSAEPALITDHATPTPAPADNAPALLVNGEPANPLCFAPYVMREDAMTTISLDPATCAPGMTATDKDFEPIAHYTGTGFYWDSDPDAQGMRAAFVAYRLLGPVGDELAIEVIGSGGGTGIFTTLFTATRQDNTLTITQTYAGGDRCNGGLTDAGVKDGKLTYAINVTPYDFITLGTDKEPEGIRAYDDLDACAACCFAKALYENGEFTGVTLNAEVPQVEQPSDRPAQSCFDKIMSAQEKTEWSPTDYAPLRDRIRQDCRHD